MGTESAVRGSRRLAGRLVTLAAAALCVAAGSASSTEAVGPLPADSNAVETDMLATPTTLDRIGRIVVPVTINGQGPFRFVVDTGASSSTLSPKLARVLGLSSQSTILLNGITGTAEVPAVSVKHLQAGELTISDRLLPVVWAPLMAGADGILGLAGVDSPNLLVDFQRNRVQLASRSL